MTYQDDHRADAIASSITVRAAAGQLKIIPVWQALGQHASQARRTRVHCHRKHQFDEMTVTFESISRADVLDIARRVSALPWVVAATLDVGESSSSSMH
ncbi:hypothetical protein [Paraburkholderia sp. GAS334]|jgi:hypothetical protein|uniref:hypothetical protein n=1 Tax=unclassified Paraburkholderia TaxID=2615204 RepID=UPI003D1F6C39